MLFVNGAADEDIVIELANEEAAEDARELATEDAADDAAEEAAEEAADEAAEDAADEAAEDTTELLLDDCEDWPGALLVLELRDMVTDCTDVLLVDELLHSGVVVDMLIVELEDSGELCAAGVEVEDRGELGTADAELEAKDELCAADVELRTPALLDIDGGFLTASQTSLFGEEPVIWLYSVHVPLGEYATPTQAGVEEQELMQAWKLAAPVGAGAEAIVWVTPFTTRALADDARLIVVPCVVIAPPGVSVCPPILY